jgi:hypothetical protein
MTDIALKMLFGECAKDAMLRERNMLRNHPDDARAGDVFRDSQFFLRYSHD